tara:strand:- start:815 stop:1957 length:1143 start_codon:yes stop_codon:yes gene_type:complete
MADQALIQGAYNVARADAAASQASLQGKLDIISSVGKSAGMFLEGINLEGKKYDEYAQKVIDEAGMLSQEETANLYNELQAGRNNFIWGSKKDKTLSMRELGLQAMDYKDYQNARLDLANLKQDGTSGLSSAWLQDPKNKDVLNIMDNMPRLVKKKCEGDCPDKGRLGVNINGEWTSISALNSKIQSGLIDSNFKKDLNTLVNKFSEDSKNIVEGEDDSFPMYEAKQKVNSLINNSSNLQSVAKDPMFGETSWYEDRFLKLTDLREGESYADLGITPEMISGTNVDIKDGIQEDEAVLLLDSMMKNENILKQELSEYYIMYLGQNWNGVKRRRPKEGYFDKKSRFQKIPYDAIETIDENGRVVFILPDGTVKSLDMMDSE